MNSLTVTGENLDIPMTPQQMEFFYGGEYSEINYLEHFNCCPKGRRFGITNGAANFVIDQMLANTIKVLWVDTVQVNLDKYYVRYFKIPILSQIKKEYWSYRSQAKELHILNSVMDLRSAQKPENIEGFGYDLIIINEAGIVLKGQKGRNLWLESIFPMTMDYKARVYFLGTPKGRRAKKDEKPEKHSLYFELASRGLYLPESNSPLESCKKLPNWRTINYTTYDNPILDPEVIKEVEAEVPFALRRQEIHGEFIDKGDETVFKTEWFHIVHELPPEHLWRRLIISMDTAFKAGSENDDSASTVILETTVGYFILDCWAEKLEYPELVEKTKKTRCKWENANYILVEDKASGQSLLQSFKKNVDYPMVAIKVDTDKYSRAVAVSPLFETGKVFCMFGAWNKMLIDQMTDFNELMDTPDDIVDTVSQGLNYLSGSMSPKSPMVYRKNKRRSKTLRGY